MAATHASRIKDDPPEPAVRRREASSVDMLAQRVRAVGHAYRAGDECATRAELRLLSSEAQLLAAMSPLVPGLLQQRQRIAAESDGLGRIG
jgi:hypothetical protein